MKQPRALAALALAPILNKQSSLAKTLPKALENCEVKDRPLLQELCYGTLRWCLLLEACMSELISKPLRAKDNDIKALLLIGAYQITYMRIPEHAAINETVKACHTLSVIQNSFWQVVQPSDDCCACGC